MNELEKYSDEELREELKRRRTIKRLAACAESRKRDHWIYWKGQVINEKVVHNIGDGYTYTFAVRPLEGEKIEPFDYKTIFFTLLFRTFTQANQPKIGDIVKLRCYSHKRGNDRIEISKIIEVIKRRF